MTAEAMSEGRTKISGPFTMRIELGKVREFLRATGAAEWDLPPDSDAPIPATFLTTTRFWDAVDAKTLLDVADLDLKRLLHGSQEYEFPAAPPRVGETLTYSTFLVSSYAKTGARGGEMRFFVTETEFLRPSGELAAVGRGTFVETAPVASYGVPMVIPGEISVGLGAPQRTFGPVTPTDIVRYQGASGDMNPIHHDPDFARRAGFPSVFSVGMLQAGLLANYACDWLGYQNLRAFGVRFRDKVWPGDRLTFDATVTAVREKDGVRLVDLDLTCTRQGGDTALAGTATFALPH